ncbi:MAG: hypothetical protein O3B35_05015 [Proteobacteria bacterium]|nr:hypothetical protein [Pseudomonadota bacterium]
MKKNYKYFLVFLLLILTLFLFSETVISQPVIEARPSSNEYFPTNI